MKKRILIFWILSSCIAYSSIAQVNYQWVKSVGDNLGDGAYSIATDNDGYVYVTGKVSPGAIDFNLYGIQPNLLNVSGGTSCFIAKYDSTGNCVWAKNFSSGSGMSIGKAITVDGIGNIYVGGIYQGSVDFDPGTPTVSLSTVGGSLDAFIAKYDASGGFQWVKSIGGIETELITSIIINPSDNNTVYFSGTFTSDTAIIIDNTDTLFNKGEVDAFVAGAETSTGSISWYNIIGGLGNDLVSDIDVGNSYLVVTGSFEDSVVFFNQYYNQDTLYSYDASGHYNAFYGKYHTDGTYGWMNNIGGAANSALGTAIVIKNDYDIYLSGVFNGTVNFKTDGSTSTTPITSSGSRDMYIAKYDIGDNLSWAERVGSANGETNSSSMAVDNNTNIYLGGYFSGQVNFDPSGMNNLFQYTSNGGYDVFFSKYDSNGGILWAKKIGGIQMDSTVSISVDDNNDIYLAGEYKDTVDFDANLGIAVRSSKGNEDIFLAKYAQGFSTIKGSVTYGTNNDTINDTSSANYVRLYTQILYDGNIAMKLVEETEIDDHGKYIFTNIPDGQYLALAIPGNNYNSIAAPTYYTAANILAVQWEDADTIIAQSTMPAFVANINMLKYPSLQVGTGILSGKVIEGGGFDRTAGNGIGGTDVGLDGVPGGRLVTTQTDQDGNYQFNNIPQGCYRIYVNLPGLPMDSTYNRCMDSTESYVDLDFIADSNSVCIESATGITENTNKASDFSIYPNPFNSIFVIEYALKSATEVKIELYNLLGEKLMELSSPYSAPGVYKKVVDVSGKKDINSGVYFLNIRRGDEVSTRRIVQMN